MHIRLHSAGRQFSTPQDYGLSPEKKPAKRLDQLP